MATDQTLADTADPIPALLGDVAFDRQGGSITVQMRFPRRGLSVLLLLVAVLGVFMLVCSAGIYFDGQLQRYYGLFVLSVAFGLAATFGFGLGGLYLLTRRRQVRMDRTTVTVRQGWCLWRSSRRTDLAEYEGLRPLAKKMGAMDADSAAGSVLGLAAAAVAGSGVVVTKKITVFFLELVHSQDRSRNVTLTGSEDPQAIAALAKMLTKTFDLSLLKAAR